LLDLVFTPMVIGLAAGWLWSIYGSFGYHINLHYNDKLSVQGMQGLGRSVQRPPLPLWYTQHSMLFTFYPPTL
jgi:hypothetical protein